MDNSFSSLCDAFYVDMQVNTELELPNQRDTVLTFFERIRKQFPAMGNFYRRESGDFCLEQEMLQERYRYVNLDTDRLCSGCVCPTTMEDAHELNMSVLELAPYMLGLSSLDIASLDLTYTMDFDCKGNHHEIVSEAFMAGTPFASFADTPGATQIGCCPSAIIAFDEDCRLQARVAVESRTPVFDIRNRKYRPGDPISIYMTIRRYPGPDAKFEAPAEYRRQVELAEQLMVEKILPNFVSPLTAAIARR
ncbi:hypothetical protein STSP2_00767 [Anaerohalosphaera lusitana]|uniref:Uncharacterized protein n=1 Tax=Anaerohalosphaera lusitana TaxID=1936003 RepID=A0A1U9NI65_9BACT|nr:hypothetical protein [Anaerohalosphaera lusitana]AQT67619.1 hypothetical protein STSP2_00767 [Anaerohalosphaera lusitana]